MNKHTYDYYPIYKRNRYYDRSNKYIKNLFENFGCVKCGCPDDYNKGRYFYNLNSFIIIYFCLFFILNQLFNIHIKLTKIEQFFFYYNFINNYKFLRVF